MPEWHQVKRPTASALLLRIALAKTRAKWRKEALKTVSQKPSSAMESRG